MTLNLTRAACRAPFAAFVLLCLSCLSASCTTSGHKKASPIAPGQAPPSQPTPVVRNGRYTLVELMPDVSQQDLMQQVVDLTLPATGNTTVADALRFVLLHSGYRLCDGSSEVRELEAFPLPAAHVRIGPLRLREVLQLLVGTTWQVEVDEANRKVCFARRPPPSADAPSSKRKAPEPAISRKGGDAQR